MWSYLTATLVLLPVVFGGQECYVCVPVKGAKSLELNYQFPREELPVCQRGVTPPPKLCPPRYKGCVTQYNGEYVTKTCGELLMNICQEVNNVEYCYCSGTLCNEKDKNETNRRKTEPPKVEEKHPTDDEDIVEGSGQSSHETKSDVENSIELNQNRIDANKSFSSRLLPNFFSSLLIVLILA